MVYRSGNTLYLKAGGKTDTYALKDVDSQDQQAALLTTVIEKIRKMKCELKNLSPTQSRTQVLLAA